MSEYSIKLLELEAIEKQSDKYLLSVKLSFGQDIQMLWEIDEYTFQNLEKATRFDQGYRYRLSLNSSWNIIHKKYVTILTQTYLEQSDQLQIFCSKDFIDKLSIIKHAQSFDDLDKLFFTSESLDPIKEEQDEIVEFNKYNSKFTVKSIAVVGLVFVILFSLLNRIYIDNTALGEEVLAQSTQADNGINEKQNMILDQWYNILFEDISYHKPSIPFVELDQPITYSIPEGTVALTFDDGPSKYSREILDILKQYEAGATFFFTGINARKYPDHVEYIKSNGYSVGSHSMNHLSMSTLSYESQENEILESGTLLEEITKETTTLFRPPYGAFNQGTKDLLNEHNYKMVLWNKDPKDWQTRDADTIFNDIQNSNISGSIILLHESQSVIDALPRIIEYLQELDLEIVNLQ